MKKRKTPDLEKYLEGKKRRDLLWSNISLLEKKVMINPTFTIKYRTDG